MSYFPLTKADQAEMLEAVGVEHFGQLLQSIPSEIRNPKVELPAPLSELEAQNYFRSLAGKNWNHKEHLSFLGAGAYEHFIPSVVKHITGRSEFYTAYTPYQPEASQGMLQAIFEYQSLICELTGMEVSNGSHYDGATALAESVLMCLHQTGRKKALLARSLHPDYRQTTKTYLKGTAFSSEEIPFGKNFELVMSELKAKLSSDVACVAMSVPNFFGLVEDLSEIERLVHENGSLLILVSNPLSLGFYKTPKEWGADIACGEGQPLGIPMSFGGPWLGFMATNRTLMRRLPGRLVGMTNDSEGRRVFCLTLQAREQHIRRERASSNICTNQALCALAASVYLASLGKTGLKRIAELNMENACYLRSALSKLKGVEIVTQGAIFNEFAVRFTKPANAINEGLLKKGIIGGVSLERFYPELKNQLLICATETKRKEDLDQFISVIEGIAK
jgi:glycine dehydrogenase subunit 1